MPSLDFLSLDYLRDPYACHKLMRDEHPLYFHEPTRSWVISRYEDVSRAFQSPDFSSKSYEWQVKDVYPGRTIMAMDGKEHASYRNIVAPALREHDLRARGMRLLAENARTLIDEFRYRGEVDLVDAFTTRYPINLTIDLLGLPRSDRERFHHWYQCLVRFITNLEQDPETNAQGARARDELCAYLAPIIRDRREHPRDDLITAIATAEVDGAPIRDEEVQSYAALLLVGGGETVDNGLGLLFKNLVMHPDQLEAVRRDRSLVSRAFAESLRYTPSAQLVMRMTVADVQVSGGTIPKDSLVTVMIAAANRDVRQFERPDAFDIHRRDLDAARAFTASANHVAFGLGRHFCIGAALAKVEVEVATNQLLDAMLDVRFVDGPPADSNYFIRGPRTLPLRFTPAVIA